MDANELIDVRYKASKVSAAGKIEITLEIDDLESPEASIKLLESRFSFGDVLSWFDVLAVGWYIRRENEKRKKLMGGQT